MENQQQQNTPLCRGNCGFYGSPATEDLCSKCFKDMIKRKQETGTTPATGGMITMVHQSTHSSSASTPMPGDRDPETASAASTSSVSLSSQPAESKPTESGGEQASANTAIELTPIAQTQEKKPNRCWVCNKRVGLTGFECRCGGLYCGEHRYDTAHGCTFDYKTAGREELRKKHPQVITEKVQKI